MSTSAQMFFMLPIVMFVFVLMVPLVVGIYVYRDAMRRRMNGLLWALVAALVPGLIGFVIYLLVRGNYTDLRCPQCDTPVQKDFTVCPHCGCQLRPSCPNCSAPVEPDWKVCPRCTQPLPEKQAFTPPVHVRDRLLGKILAVVLIVPLLLIALVLIGSAAFSGGGTCGMQEVTWEEYRMTQPSETIKAEVQNWLDGAAEEKRAYVLHYTEAVEDGTQRESYLLYVPGAGNASSTGVGQSSDLFGTTITVNLEYTGNSDSMYDVQSTTTGERSRLKVVLDGKKIPCDVVDVDFNPSLFGVVSAYSEEPPEDGTFSLPQQITVTKLVDAHNGAVVGIADTSTIASLVADIEDAPYLNTDHPLYSSNDEMQDGFDLAIAYVTWEGKDVREDVVHFMVFEKDGGYYLLDSNRPDQGRSFRRIDENLYHTLEGMFV